MYTFGPRVETSGQGSESEGFPRSFFITPPEASARAILVEPSVYVIGGARYQRKWACCLELLRGLGLRFGLLEVRGHGPGDGLH